MNVQDEVLDALEEAVLLSPDSSALRRHYAEMLLNRGYPARAESEFRRALQLDGADAASKLGLARALQSQSEHSSALDLVKQVIRESNRPAKAYILYARLLLDLGSVERAVAEYRKALSVDPAAYDPALASELGLPDAVEPETQEVSEDLEAEEGEAETTLDDDFSRALRQLFTSGDRLTFQEVGGLERVKEEIGTMMLHPLNHREYYRAYDKPVGGRLLVYGPSGCGKTHLARAIAGEVLAPFLTLDLHRLAEIWQEDSDRIVREIFQQAREQGPWVLFFDDVDGTTLDQPALRQFLYELAGEDVDNEGLLIMVASRAPWRAEPELVRPDRYDRVLFLPPPTFRDRVEILRIQCLGKPQGALDLERLAEVTAGFSGAELTELVKRTVARKLQLSLQAGRPEPLTTEDLLAAAAQMTSTTGAWLDEAREQLPSSRHQDDVFDDLRAYLQNPDP